MIVLPENGSVSSGFRRLLVGLAAILLASAVYLAYEHGCSLANPQTSGGASYAALALAFFGLASGGLALALSSWISKPLRVLLLLTLPITAFLVPLVLLGVVEELAQRICAS